MHAVIESDPLVCSVCDTRSLVLFPQEAVSQVEPTRAQGVSLGGQVAGVLLARHRACVPQHVRAHVRTLPPARLARQVPRYFLSGDSTTLSEEKLWCH